MENYYAISVLLLSIIRCINVRVGVRVDSGSAFYLSDNNCWNVNPVIMLPLLLILLQLYSHDHACINNLTVLCMCIVYRIGIHIFGQKYRQFNEIIITCATHTHTLCHSRSYSKCLNRLEYRTRIAFRNGQGTIEITARYTCSAM